MIKPFVGIPLIFLLLFFSCKDEDKEELLSKDQIEQIHNFVEDLNASLYNFEFDFIKSAWNHTLFKRRIGKLGSIGHGVFDHFYETTIKNYILNTNLDLINKVKHSGATLKHIDTNIADSYAEVTYLLIEKGFYYFRKYRIEFQNRKPFLTDVFIYKEDQWFSYNMRELVLLNTNHTAMSPNRHEANRAYDSFQYSMDNGEYQDAFVALERVPESHRIFNDYKIAKIITAARLSDSLLTKTIEEETDFNNEINIYIDYLMAYYSEDTIYRDEVDVRMRREIGISKSLLDSLNSRNLIWE